MKKLIISVLGALLLAGGSLFAQDISRARELYGSGMYSQAAALLQNVEGADAEGLRVLCSIGMQSPGYEDEAASFLDRYPESVLSTEVEFAWALDLFDKERFEDAYFHFCRISEDDVYPSRRAEYAYKKAYSAFGVGEWERAKQLLMAMRNLPKSDYTAPAYYSLGYINYAQGNFHEAADWFLRAADDHRFTALANYYILECRFNEKDYRYVVEFGEDLFNSIPADRQPHMARIMSESYLILGDVDKARSYYEQNLRNKGALTRSDYFYSGEVLFLVEDWQGAVDNFSQMPARTDSLGQIANYQMGYSYVRLHNKVAALDAFREASEQSYSAEIQEDAFFNFAKLSFDINGDTAPFTEYLERYGTRSKGDRIYSYMAMAALQNHDYEAAVAAYDQIETLEPRMQSNYMKAYFLRAVELMESGSYRDAVPHLRAAAYYSPRRDPFNQLARYWLAEAQYRDGKYAEARSILTDLYNLSALNGRPEGDLISYQVAYTYFREGDYDHALRWFQNYLTGNADAFGADAETRIGDCYFFKGDYPTAIVAYERRLADYPLEGDIYPAFRAGVACGLIQEFDRKVYFLENVKSASPQVPYYNEAMYELGRAYVSTGNDDDAIRTFRTLRATSTDPAYATLSLLELGLVERNRGNVNVALTCYKLVVEQGGDYVEEALLAIESIYRTMEDPEGYLDYVDSLGDRVNRTDEQKEEVYFSTAEQIFMGGDAAKSINTLLGYLEQYPNGANVAKARFYLGESYRAIGDRERAADAYAQALEGGLEGSFAETALLRFADISLELGHYGKAFGSYLSLKESARMPENVAAAEIGMMRAAFRAREWEDAAEAAQVVARRSDATPELKREAMYVTAKSYLASSRRTEALAILEDLSDEPSTAEGAEAAVLLIQDLLDNARFDDVQRRVQAFAQVCGGQNYWLAKAFIILADSYERQGNIAQARATLESIRDGYRSQGPGDDIPDQVELRLHRLQ